MRCISEPLMHAARFMCFGKDFSMTFKGGVGRGKTCFKVSLATFSFLPFSRNSVLTVSLVSEHVVREKSLLYFSYICSNTFSESIF